jgi:hypothetical protein
MQQTVSLKTFQSPQVHGKEKSAKKTYCPKIIECSYNLEKLGPEGSREQSHIK